MSGLHYQNLARKKIDLHITDAIFPLKMPTRDIAELSAQKIEWIKKIKRNKATFADDSINSKQARIFLESSEFDEWAVLAGYDTYFVKRAFELVQTALDIKKEIRDYQDRHLQS